MPQRLERSKVIKKDRKTPVKRQMAQKTSKVKATKRKAETQIDDIDDLFDDSDGLTEEEMDEIYDEINRERKAMLIENIRSYKDIMAQILRKRLN